MTTHIALLRAVNVGGRSQVAMADLRRLFTDLGFADVKSLLQSGNLVFRADAATGAELEATLEAETQKRLAVQTAFFVRTAHEMDAVVAANPFSAQAAGDPSHLVVVFLKSTPQDGAGYALRAAIKGPELVELRGSHAYIFYPAGIGESGLTSAMIDAKLGTKGTGRNWNTVIKLATLARG